MDAPHFRMAFEVAFADTDASGWMHFSNILRYVERAEHAFLRSQGIEVFDLTTGGWPRVQVECQYRKPLQAGDGFTMELKITRVGGSSVTWQFEALDASGEIAAMGSMTTVQVDATGKPSKISADMREALMGKSPEVHT